MIEEFVRRLRQNDISLRLDNERLICNAPQGAMTPDLVEELRVNKDAIIAFLKREGEADPSEIRIARAPRDADIPLSFSQESLWFLDQLNPGRTAYNISLRIHTTAEFDDATFQRSLNEVLRRHEILRTQFQNLDGLPKQIIRPPGDVPFAVVDLSGESIESRQRLVDQACQQETATPFRIDQDILIRARVLNLQKADKIILLTVHHIAADATSIDLIVQELFLIYRAFASGQPSPLNEPALQYADFAVWQRGYVGGEATERQLSYWKRQMAGAPAVLELPLDWPRRTGRLFRSSSEAAAITGPLTQRLKNFARSEGASLFMTALAAFQVLLYRCSGQSDVVVGSAISGRRSLELESVVGLFVNTLPLRIDLSGNPSFRDVLLRVREIVLEAHQNQDIPFERLVSELRPPRDAGRNPLFQVFFSFRNRVGEDASTGISSEVLQNDAPKFDLSLSVEEFSHKTKLEIEYCEDLFRRERVVDLLKRLSILLQNIADAPETGIDDLPLFDEADQQAWLAESVQSRVDYDLSRSAYDAVLQAAKLYPQREAVRFASTALTYEQLISRVEMLAQHLWRAGAGPGGVVGICLERSLDLMVALLATLRSGAAFLPLDPGFPSERLAYMVKDASPVVVLTHRPADEILPSSTKTRIYLDDLPEADQSFVPESTERLPTDLAYVIYTSGSTGLPKGVEIPHQALTNFLCSMRDLLDVTPNDAVLAITTISFDIAILELLLPLVCGGRVVLASRDQASDAAELMRLMREEKISLMQATPTTWRLLLEAQWTGDRSLKILCGGEAWSEDLAGALLSRCGSLWNMYGPTETTIWSAARQISRGDRVLIGPPIANTQFMVLGPNGQPQPRYIPGELCIGGTGVARGYHERKDLTEEKFVANQFSHEKDRLYKTGDLVRQLSDGDLEFLGRKDNQVKLRGYRIEPDEIAAVLRLHPAVIEAVVVLYGTEDHNKQLVAYYTSVNGEPIEEDLRSFVRSKLPSYMVPSSVEVLDQLPVTPNGKTDRKALERRIPSARVVASTSIPPRTDAERAIAQTWERFLGIKGLGISDDLFELGAHSMMIVQVIHALNSSFNLRFGVSDIFDNPTVERLAAIAETEHSTPPQDASVVELRQGGTDVPIYFIYSGSVEVTLARALPGDHPVFGVEMRWPLEWREAITANQTALFPKMDEIVDRFVGAISSHAGTGKCVLAGYSFAGVLAFEVARRLSMLGDRIETVVIIDKWLPYPPIHSVAWTGIVNCWKAHPPDKSSFLSSLPTRLVRSSLILCWVVESFVRALASSLWLRPNQLTEFLDEEGIPLRWYLVERLYKEIERHYELKPLDCKGIVLRPEFLDRYGVVEAPAKYLRWGEMFRRGSQDLTVAGDHFSMVRTHARALAQRIAEAIKRS